MSFQIQIQAMVGNLIVTECCSICGLPTHALLMGYLQSVDQNLQDAEWGFDCNEGLAVLQIEASSQETSCLLFDPFLLRIQEIQPELSSSRTDDLPLSCICNADVSSMNFCFVL